MARATFANDTKSWRARTEPPSNLLAYQTKAVAVTFADLFKPVLSQNPETSLLRRERREQEPNLTSREIVCVLVHSGEHTRSCIEAELGVAPSAPSAARLVPLETPFIDGHRYRGAGATEARTRHGKLDLFFADPAGPWIRQHGVLLSVAEVTAPRQ